MPTRWMANPPTLFLTLNQNPTAPMIPDNKDINAPKPIVIEFTSKTKNFKKQIYYNILKIIYNLINMLSFSALS